MDSEKVTQATRPSKELSLDEDLDEYLILNKRGRELQSRLQFRESMRQLLQDRWEYERHQQRQENQPMWRQLVLGEEVERLRRWQGHVQKVIHRGLEKMLQYGEMCQRHKERKLPNKLIQKDQKRRRRMRKKHEQNMKYFETMLRMKHPGLLWKVLVEAFMWSTLAPFIKELNVLAGFVSVETQRLVLDLLTFTYAKEGEDKELAQCSAIFPSGEYAIKLIKKYLKGKSADADGQIPIRFIFENLSELQLSDKFISYPDNSLCSFTVLRHLNLSRNLIASLRDFLLPPRLQYLNLEMNLLTHLELTNQPGMHHLRCLVLSWNHLSDSSNLRPLRFLTGLCLLDLSYNHISLLDTLWNVLHTSHLQSLMMIGNPCSVAAAYVENVVNHAPRLLYLDNILLAEYKAPISNKDVTHQSKHTSQECISQSSNRRDEESMDELEMNGQLSNPTPPLEEDAELRIHPYRVFNFTPPPLPRKTWYWKKKKSTRTKRKGKRTKRKEPLQLFASDEPLTPRKPNNPHTPNNLRRVNPSDLRIPTEVLYRFELETPIMNEQFHELVKFIKSAEDDEAPLPYRLTNPSKFKRRVTPSPKHPESVLDFFYEIIDDWFDTKVSKRMTVGKVKELLAAMLEENGEAVNRKFNTNFVTHAIPAAPFMEFDSFSLRPPYSMLKHLSNMFYTQVKLHFVQLIITSTREGDATSSKGTDFITKEKLHKKSSKKKDRDTKKNAAKKRLLQRLSKKKKKKTKKGHKTNKTQAEFKENSKERSLTHHNQSSRNRQSSSSPNPKRELQILQRTVLHTIVLDKLTEPTWTSPCQNFIWTPSGGVQKEEKLMDFDVERSYNGKVIDGEVEDRSRKLSETKKESKKSRKVKGGAQIHLGDDEVEDRADRRSKRRKMSKKSRKIKGGSQIHFGDDEVEDRADKRSKKGKVSKKSRKVKGGAQIHLGVDEAVDRSDKHSKRGNDSKKASKVQKEPTNQLLEFEVHFGVSLKRTNNINISM